MSLKRFLSRNIVIPLRIGRLFRTVVAMPRIHAQWRQYVRSSSEVVRRWDWFLQIDDATTTTPFDPHYFHQSAWAARNIAQQQPPRHVDVGSQIDLIAPLCAFVDVEFVDLRPLEVSLPRLICTKGSILSLPYADCSVRSLSCLHVIEHIGLGRYGDPIDPEGSKKGCKELQRVIASGGHLYLSTPIGRERVEFNAHRIHSPTTIIQLFNELKLVQFSCVDDRGVYKDTAVVEECKNFSYGLGLFHFIRY